jgi:hypothetical protein
MSRGTLMCSGGIRALLILGGISGCGVLGRKVNATPDE